MLQDDEYKGRSAEERCDCEVKMKTVLVKVARREDDDVGTKLMCDAHRPKGYKCGRTGPENVLEKKERGL